MVQKKLSSPIWKFTGDCGGVLENDLQFVYKWSWCKTFIPSPISIKMAVWYPCFGKCSPIVYSYSHLIARGKPKVPPLLKTFLTYMNKNDLLNTLFWKMFTEYLQMSSHNSHRKTETAPLLKKYLSPIRTKNSRFTGASAIYLHFVYTLGVLSLT